jgi:hypothetical protein
VHSTVDVVMATTTACLLLWSLSPLIISPWDRGAWWVLFSETELEMLTAFRSAFTDGEVPAGTVR